MTEPSTPTFSGLDSPMVIALKTKDQGSLDVPKTFRLLGQEWARFWPVKTAFPLLSNSATPSVQSPGKTPYRCRFLEGKMHEGTTPPLCQLRCGPDQNTRLDELTNCASLPDVPSGRESGVSSPSGAFPLVAQTERRVRFKVWAALAQGREFGNAPDRQSPYRSSVS